MNKFIIVCGPTATGKTSLALKLAKSFKAEIISADSRQVYKGMDIITGKDIPKDFSVKKSNLMFDDKPIFYYENKTKIWGYDIVNPDQIFSVNHYNRYVDIVMKNMKKKKILPIIVGGTGLYLKSLTHNIATLKIPPNFELREKFKTTSIGKLQSILIGINKNEYLSMNSSDKRNPRRLIRLIEVLMALNIRQKTTPKKDIKCLWIGLKLPWKTLSTNILHRIRKRIESGAEQEIITLLKKGYSFSLPSMTAIGYREWQNYFKGDIQLFDVINKWIINENKYAKRQMVWLKNQSDINWYDSSKKNTLNKVVEKVSQWYY
jgi:tRNA dimethylallyltransferase